MSRMDDHAVEFVKWMHEAAKANTPMDGPSMAALAGIPPSMFPRVRHHALNLGLFEVTRAPLAYWVDHDGLYMGLSERYGNSRIQAYQAIDADLQYMLTRSVTGLHRINATNMAFKTTLAGDRLVTHTRRIRKHVDLLGEMTEEALELVQRMLMNGSTP